MNYDGIEIDMMNVGNADAILVTRWEAGIATRILIDGGNAGDVDKVAAFLKTRGAMFLNHIVCSHPHDDHAAGLVELVKRKDIDFGQAWLHVPWNHIDYTSLEYALKRGETSASRVVKIIRASTKTTQALVAAIEARGKTIKEPFQGEAIGFLFVCGPSKAFYEQLLKEFTDLERLNLMEASIAKHEQQLQAEALLEAMSFGGQKYEAKESGLGQAPTEPENNSSTILWTKFGENALLFTADAGVEALTLARNAYKLDALRWMQIPHHGSRRNLTEELISYFKPNTAYVSAEGSTKHPRRQVVNAFKAVGTSVFSTHYPTGGPLWLHLGNVPPRPDYSSATALYDAKK